MGLPFCDLRVQHRKVNRQMDLKLFKISNGALKGDSLPKRLKVLSWGDNATSDGPVKVGQKTIDGIAAQAKTGFDRVAIDFDHCTVSTTSVYKELLGAGQAPLIFGYGRPTVVNNDGLYFEDIVWTPLGEKHARNFEDLSPAIVDKDGEVNFVHSLALTANGKVKDLHFFSAKTETTAADVGAADDASSAATEASGKAIESGKQSDHEKASKLHAKAMVAQAKAGNADKAANHAKAVGIHDTAAADCAETKTMSADDMKPEELTLLINNAVTAAITPLSAKVSALETSLATGAKATEDAERERIIKLFSAEGKSPKNEDGKDMSVEDLRKKDVATLKLLHANTPVTVPLNARSRTAGTDNVKTYVQRDTAGKVLSVDMATLFNDEAARNGQLRPDAVAAN